MICVENHFSALFYLNRPSDRRCRRMGNSSMATSRSMSDNQYLYIFISQYYHIQVFIRRSIVLFFSISLWMIFFSRIFFSYCDRRGVSFGSLVFFLCYVFIGNENGNKWRELSATTTTATHKSSPSTKLVTFSLRYKEKKISKKKKEHTHTQRHKHTQFMILFSTLLSSEKMKISSSSSYRRAVLEWEMCSCTIATMCSQREERKKRPKRQQQHTDESDEFRSRWANCERCGDSIFGRFLIFFLTLWVFHTSWHS